MAASRSEGFNLTAMEAMACRTPVVSTSVGWPEEVLLNGINGALVDVEDATGLAGAAHNILRLPDQEWCRMSDEAYETVRDCSWDRSVGLFERRVEPPMICNDARPNSCKQLIRQSLMCDEGEVRNVDEEISMPIKTTRHTIRELWNVSGVVSEKKGSRRLRQRLFFVSKALSLRDELRRFEAPTPGGAFERALQKRPEIVGAVVWPYICANWDRDSATSTHRGTFRPDRYAGRGT